MSRRPVLASNGSLLLLAVFAACATPGKTGDPQNLTRDHVYLGTRDELAAQVTAVLTGRGLVVVRLDENRLQTPWKIVNLPQRTGSYTEATDRGSGVLVYENIRVTFFSVDERHHVLRVERGRSSALLGTQNTQTAGGVASNQLKAAHEGVDPVLGDGAATALTLPRGTTAPEYTPDPELEWEVLQKVDPGGAHSIEHEQIVASGRSELRAPPPPPPEVLRVASDCPDIPGVDDLLAAHRLVVLGEVHGTEQAPQFVGALACRSAAQGLPLAIGLELPRQENPALERYLGSSGTAADRKRFLEGEAWRREWRDGRSSAAMLALIEQVRVLRKAGADILLVGMDDPRWTGDERDRSMARFLDTFRRRTLDRPMIILVGNLHAQLTPGNVTASYRPLGARLETFGLRPVSLLMAYDGGTTWLCTYGERLGCGVHPVAGWPPPTKVMPREVALRPGLDYSLGLPLPTRFVRQWGERTDGFDGFFYVGPLTASWPAVKSEETRTDGRQAPPQ